MTVIYMDSVFLLNGLVDYLLLLLTARFAGLQLRRRRYILASLFGACYAAAAFLPWGLWLSTVPVKLAAGVLVALIAYGGEECFLRLLLLFFGLSCAFAGGVLGLGLLTGYAMPRAQGIFYTDIDGKRLVMTATVAYFLVRFIFHAAAEQGLQGKRLPVTLWIGEKPCSMTALLDSGNSLKDLNGEPVLVVELQAVAALLPLKIAGEMKRGVPPAELLDALRKADPSLQPQLLSYRSVGREGGLLLSLRTQQAEIGGTCYPALRIAVCPTPLGSGFQALWGGAAERREQHARDPA